MENAPSKYKLSLEQVDGLLRAIYATLGLEEGAKKKLSLHDRMYAGLSEPKNHTFPVHAVITETIQEWSELERKPFFPRAHKTRFPFDEDPAPLWNKVPKLDAAFFLVSRSTDLAFKDMGILKEPVDKKMDQQLKSLSIHG